MIKTKSSKTPTTNNPLFTYASIANFKDLDQSNILLSFVSMD